MKNFTTEIIGKVLGYGPGEEEIRERV